jgi:hypothetical protein
MFSTPETFLKVMLMGTKPIMARRLELFLDIFLS